MRNPYSARKPPLDQVPIALALEAHQSTAPLARLPGFLGRKKIEILDLFARLMRLMDARPGVPRPEPPSEIRIDAMEASEIVGEGLAGRRHERQSLQRRPDGAG